MILKVTKICIFLGIILLLGINSCTPREEKPECCNDIDTTSVNDFDESILDSTPFFVESKRFVYLDSNGNEAAFENHTENIEDYLVGDSYDGICNCDDNYLMTKVEYYRHMEGTIFSADLEDFYLEFEARSCFDDLSEVELYVRRRIDYYSYSGVSFTVNGDAYDIDTVNLLGKTFTKVYKSFLDSVLYVNQSQGVVGFRDEDNTLWVLDRIEPLD